MKNLREHHRDLSSVDVHTLISSIIATEDQLNIEGIGSANSVIRTSSSSVYIVFEKWLN